MRKSLAQLVIAAGTAALVLLAFGLGSWLGGSRGEVAPAATGAELQVISQANGGAWHSLRRSTGAWTAFGNVYGETGNPGVTSLVATTKLGTDLVVVPVVSGRVFVTARHASGFWDGIANIGECGAVSSVAVAGVGAELHVLAVTEDGSRLAWAMRKADLTWTPFTDAFASAGTPSGKVTDVAAAEIGGSLQVVVVAGGTLQSAVRHADGTWAQFAPVPGVSGAVAVGAADVSGALAVLASTDGGVSLVSTTRTSSGWSAVETVPGLTEPVTGLAAASVGDALHAVVATPTKVLHASRGASEWSAFTQAGSNQPPGPTLDVAASGV